MNENTNYENLSVKKEIEDPSETIVPTSVPLPTSVFNVEFNNSIALCSEINSNLVLNVNNPANSKPAPKKRKCTRRRHVYSKPKKRNKKKKEAEKMPVLSEQNLQHLIEKKSNDNCSDSSDTIILDDEELLSHTSDFANKLPNILIKKEELEPELGKLLISSGMLLEDTDESFITSSKITNSKDQSKISNVPLIKQEPEEFSEPPVLYPVMKEAVRPYFDHERLKMTTFPLLSGSVKKSTQPSTKKKQTQAAQRGNKKQAACEKTISEPNKTLRESLSFDNFSTTNEKNVFSGVSFENINDTVSKSNLFAKKSKRKRPAPKRGASKKTVQISSSLNNESISGNGVTAFPSLSPSKKKKPQTARRGGKKQAACERTVSEPNKILNENFTLDDFPPSNEKDFFHGQSVEKSKGKKPAGKRGASEKIVIISEPLNNESVFEQWNNVNNFNNDSFSESNVTQKPKIKKYTPNKKTTKDTLEPKNSFECEEKSDSFGLSFVKKPKKCAPRKRTTRTSAKNKKGESAILGKKDGVAFCVKKELCDPSHSKDSSLKHSKSDTVECSMNVSNSALIDTWTFVNMYFEVDRLSQPLLSNENSPDKNTSVETNLSNNMHPQLVDKDICNDSTVMMPNISGSCTNTCVQKYSSITNAHSLINSQNSIIDSEKILDYSNIAIKKEPEDLTECVKTSADSSRSHDQEMSQVEHSLQFCANTEKSHNSALSVGIPNVVSNSQPIDNSVHSSQSKHFEPNNVFVHKIKEEPKEAEPNSTIIENSRSAVKSHNQNELDHMKTFLINETGRESTLKEALPLHSSHDNGRIASPSLNLNTLLLNESRQTNTCNREMHLLKSSSNFNANISKNFDSTPFPNINIPVHASDDSGYAQPKTFKTSFNSFLNVAIKTEPAETVEKSVCTENEHSVRSLQSLVQLECENTASKTNSTICSSDKSDNDGKHKNIGNSNSSYLNSEVSNLKLTSSTSGVHESIFREHFQSNSTPQEMLQIAVPSVKSVANRNESCHSVILPSVPSTYLDRHASDNASQIQLEIGKSSSVKVRIKEEHVEDEADEIVINIRSKPSSVHVQEFNELGKQNTCISEDSSARNSLHLFPKESTEEVSSDEVDISFNTSKSLGNPDAFSECISESTICRRMDKNSSLGNVNSTSGFVNQSLINEKTLKTVKNSSLITSSIVTSLQENVSDKLGIDQPSIDTAEKSVNGSPFCAKTGLSVHPADKVSSSDIISQTQRKMLQTMETSNLITSSTTAAHQESTICANTDLDICLIDLDCSSPVKQTVPNEKNNNLISSSTFNVKTETFCENASSLLSKEPDNVLEYNQGLLNSNSSSQSSESNFCDNLILNSVKASSNIISESSSNDGIMKSIENLVEFSDESNSSELIDVPHSFIDEDQNSLDQKLYEMSDVSDSSGSDDEFSDENVEGFSDNVSSYASHFNDKLKLSDGEGNEDSVEYVEKCFECTSKAVLDIVLSYKEKKEGNSGKFSESEKIISKPIILDGDSSDVIDSRSFNVNENAETTCTQTLTVERMNSRPVTTSNIDSVTVALNEITPEENTSSPTVIFEKITSRSIISDDTNLCNMTDSVPTAMNKITSEKEREESTCSEDVIFERISTPVSSCDTDPNNMIEFKSVINKSISEKENTNNQTATFNGIPSRPVIPLHKDPCNATDSEENTCRQTGVFEGTTPGQVTSNNSVPIVSEEETTATSERIISEPIASMDSVQIDTSSVSRFSLNQNDGKFDILFNFKKSPKKFFKYPYPGDSCFKLIQQANSVSSIREVAEKLKNAAEAESNLNFNVGDALTIERYPLTKEEIECFFKLVVMSPSICLMSKCNLAVGECPSAIPEISSNDGFDATYHPSSLNLVSRPLKLVRNPLNLLSTQIFQDDQVMEGTSFESGANEINNMPDHGSSMQNIEENNKKIIEDNTQKIAEDNTQMIIEDNTQKVIEDNTQKEMSHNVSFDSSNLRPLLENLKANILHISETISEKGVEDFTYQDCHEVFDECVPSWREMNKNSQLTKSAFPPSSELQNVLIDISHRSKETLNDMSQNIHTLANLNKSSHNILIEPLESSANPYFENELQNNSSLKSIEFQHQLPTSDPVTTQKHCLLSKTDQVPSEDCTNQPLNLFSSQYGNTSNDLSCFEKNKEIQVFTTEQNISAQSSKSEGSFNFMKETTVIPNPVLDKVNVPLTDLLKIIQTANNLPTADPVTSSNLKEAHDNDYTCLFQNSFQDNSSYDQDCLYNTKQLSRSNYCKDYQPPLKIPTVCDYNHKSAEDLDFVTLNETNKVSNDVCSSELTSTPSNDLGNESGNSNSESYNRSTNDVQDLGVSINNLEEKGPNDKKEDEQHIPQYKSRWEKIMERKSLDTSSQTKFSNHLLEDCFPVKLSKSKLNIRKPIVHVQSCSQNRSKESLKLKELPSSSNNLPSTSMSIKAKKGKLDSLKSKELPSSSNNPPPTLKSIKTKKEKLPPKKEKKIIKFKKNLKSPSKETICSDSGDAEKNSEQSSSSRVYGRITNRGSFLTQSSVNKPKSKAVVGKKSTNKMKNCFKTADEFHLMVSSPNIEIASTSKLSSNNSKELLYKSNYKTQKSGLLVESSIGANAKRPLLPTPKIGIHHHVMKNEFKLTPPIHHRYSDLNRNYSLGDLNMGISSPIQSSPSLIGSPIDLKMDSILNSPVAGQFSAVPSALNLPNRSNHHRLPRSRHSKCVCLPPRSLKASVGNAVFDTINVLLLILEWNVDWLVQQQKNHDPPPISNSVRKVINVYENIDDYYNTYFPLMLLETWQRIYMSWTHLNQASPYFCQVTSYAVETHSIKVDCQTVFKNSDADRGIFPDEGSIIMIKFGTKEKGGIKILGFVTKVKVEPFDTVTDSQNLCYRTLKFSSTENLQKLFLTFIGAYTSDGFDLNQLIRIQVLCSVKSTLKQNDALLFLKNSPLYKNILNPLTDGLRMVTVVSRCTDLLKVKDSVPECVRDIVKGILSPHPLPLLTIAKSLPSSDRLLVLPPLIEKMKHSYRTKVLLCTRTTKALTDIGFNLCTGSIKFVIMGKRTDIHQKLRKYFIDELAVKRLTKDSTENSSTNEDSKGELLENTKIDVLKNCDVILSPIRNCHNDLIAKAWVDGDTIAQMCCIIDEANLCTESEILIPLLYGMSKLILIGDPDVPAKVCSRAAANNDYNRSLFHRAYELDLASE